MIRHIVLFNLKPEVEPADRDWLFRQMQGLAKIPSVRRLAVAKLLDAREEWYKPRIATDYAWSLSMDFDDEDGLYAYQQDPYHVTVAAEIRKRTTAAKVIDFESIPDLP
jgi:hypothetical protein